MNDLRTYKYDSMARFHALNEEAMEPPAPSNATNGATNGAAPAACPQGSGSHTIQRGESLAGIAQTYAISLDELLAANPTLDPFAYRAGTLLCIPAVTQIDCCEGRLYCVQLGDTPAGLVASFGITESELTEANPILLQTGLIPGQIICIPVTGAPPACPGALEQIVLTQNAEFIDVLLAYNISYNALSQLNPDVDLSSLTPGMTLCIPANGSRGVPVGCQATYTLQQGDTLESLSQILGASMGEIMMMNPVLLPSDFVEGLTICV